MIDMSIISVGAMEFTATAPFTRNKKGMLIQHPHIAVRDDNCEYYINGRDVMWSFLDALFPGDPLPRNAIEDDLYAPHEGSPSMWQLLNDLAYEAFTDGNDYLVMYHKDGIVSMVQSLDALGLSNDIERAGAVLASMLDEEACYSVAKYRDKHGSHLRRMVSVYSRGLAYEVIDLGTRWYLRVVGEPSVCIMPPLTIPKTKEYELKSAFLKARATAMNFTPPIGELKPLPTLSSVLTREYDMLRWERYGGSA